MANTVETRRFDSTQHTINGLLAYTLTPGDLGNAPVNAYIYDGTGTYNFNFDVIIRHSDNSEDVIGSAIAQTSRSTTGIGSQNSTWDCPSTSLATTDAVKVVARVAKSTSATLTYITTQVSTWSGTDKERLVNATWTIYRHTEYQYDSEYPGYYAQITLRGYSGGGEYYSYISGFTYGLDAPITKTIADTGAGADAINLAAKSLAIADTGSGNDALSLPIPKADTGVGVDAVSVTVHVVIAEAPTVTDSVGLVSKVFTISDAASGADAISNYTGDRVTAADSATASDAVSIAVRLSIADIANGADALALAGNTATLLLVVVGFPSGQTVEYRIEDGDGNLVRDWTSSGVQEYARGDGKSRYRAWASKITSGVVDWRIPSTTYAATEVFNTYSSLADGAGYTSARASKLDCLDRANSAALASADYTAPDNAGIASNGVAIADIQADVTSILEIVALLKKYARNKRIIWKDPATGIKYLIIYDDNGTTELVRKRLKDPTAANIADLAVGSLATEEASSV